MLRLALPRRELPELKALHLGYTNKIVIFMFTTYEIYITMADRQRVFKSVKVQMKFVKVIPHLIYVWSVLENRLQIHTNNG